LSAGRILVIDDEPQIRRIMRTTLITAGYEVDDAKTAEEGLLKVREFRPDLVLLDINMPGMGGLAACRELRADPNVAIIMLTVHNTEAAKVEALDAGADDFVTKPFSTPELLARIRAALPHSGCAVRSQPAQNRRHHDRLRSTNCGARNIERPPDSEGIGSAPVPYPAPQ
jgi:DNA-binding response OmpR family regulator